MKKGTLLLIALAVALPGGLFAQNIAGTWQGTLSAGLQNLRIVVKISVEDDKLKATTFSIDRGGQPISASTISQDGSTITMIVAAIGGRYQGKLSKDGNSITGTWTQGASAPLNLVRATPDTAWTIPEPPPPPNLMSANANPSFEVATIKPSNTRKGSSILVNRSGVLNVTNKSIADLIEFAYDLHRRQIAGGPAWLETESFDVAGKPEGRGIPNSQQLKTMVQRLLTDRFQLAFHREEKELSVYAITVTKAGAKLAKSQGNGNLPGFRRGPQGLNARNATIGEFANMLQANILEQPVVDQTGLGLSRYDFTLLYATDPPQGQLVSPPVLPLGPDNGDTLPDLFTALQQQLGLKLESTKALVDILVIDRVEKPSEN